MSLMRCARQRGGQREVSLTVEELATAAGICRDNVYDAIRADQLRAKKFGKRTLVLKVDAQAFLESLPEPQAAAQGAASRGPERSLKREAPHSKIEAEATSDHLPHSVTRSGGVRTNLR